MLMSRCSAIATMHKAKRGAILADVCVVSQRFLQARLASAVSMA